MARIPTVADLGAARIPQAARNISVDRSGAINTDTLVTAIQGFGQGQAKKRATRDRFAFGKAKSALLQADMEARRVAEESPDYENAEKVYREAAAKARDTAGAMITDADDRAAFDIESTTDIERGAFAVGAIARRKRGEVDRADLESALESNRTGALNAQDPGTRQAFIDATRTLVTSAVARGSIDADAAEKTWQGWQQSYAEGYTAMLPAEERAKILQNPKGTPADLLAPDQRVLLLRSAQNENKETRVRASAQGEEDRIWSEGGGLESMRKKARAIEDPDVRDSTLSRLEARSADHEQDLERSDRMNRRAGWEVIDNGGTWEDIPARLAANMNPEDALQIKKYLADSKKGPIATDRETWYKIRQVQSEDPKAFAEMDLLQYRAHLGEEDFETFADAQVKLKEDARSGVKVRSDEQLVNSALDGMGIDRGAKAGSTDRERSAAFSMAFERELTEIKRVNNREPTPEEKKSVIDRLSIEVVKKRPWYLPDQSGRLFETPAGGQAEIVVPDDDRQQIVEAYRRRGITPTEKQIQAAYFRALGPGAQ